MVLKLPVGVLSFTVFTVLLVLPLALMAVPFTQEIFGLPIVQLSGNRSYFMPAWMYPFCWLAAGLPDERYATAAAAPG